MHISTKSSQPAPTHRQACCRMWLYFSVRAHAAYAHAPISVRGAQATDADTLTATPFPT